MRKTLAILALAFTATLCVAQVTSSRPPCPRTHPSCCLDDPNGCGILDMKAPLSLYDAALHPVR